MKKPLFEVGEEVVVCPTVVSNFSGVVLGVKLVYGATCMVGTTLQEPLRTPGYSYFVSNDPHDHENPWAERCLRKKPKGSKKTFNEVMDLVKNPISKDVIA